MTQYKGNGDPDYDEFVPYTPIVVSGRMFNPAVCIDPVDPSTPHQCVHDWRRYWGQQKRAPGVIAG